ncbi:MAG: zinc-binding dehydrogenase [Planctomycetota bacterium]
MTMLCARVREHGGPDQLLIETTDVPEPGPGEVRVRLKAAALNHLDLWVRKGVDGHQFPLPLIPGCDGAGIVEAIGEGVAPTHLESEVVLAPGLSCGVCVRCAAGDDMLCSEYGILGETRDGTCAEAVVVPEAQLLARPAGISWHECAAFPLSALTAWSMLQKAQLKRGETLLVIAGASGVGTMAIQMGTLLGARVVATGSTESKRTLAEQLGASETIDSTDETWWRSLKKITSGAGADVIFENVGETTWESSLRSLAWGGRIVTCGATSGSNVSIDLKRLFFKNQQIIGSTMGRRQDLHRLLKLQQQEQLRSVIDSVYTLEDLHAAHQRMEQRESAGKIVISIDQTG